MQSGAQNTVSPLLAERMTGQGEVGVHDPVTLLGVSKL